MTFTLPLPAGGVLETRPGAVLAVLGENGSGVDALRRSVADRLRRGRRDGAHIAWIGRRRALAPQLEVAENIFLGHELTRRWGVLSVGVDRRRTRAEATRLLESLGCSVPAHTVAGDLGEGDRILVELARALSAGAEAIVLEEPTAHLDATAALTLRSRLRELATRGLAVVILTQRPREALGVADAIVVLRDGAVVGEHDVAGSQPDDLRRRVLRELIDREYPPSPSARSSPPTRTGSELLRLAGWSVPDSVRPDRRLVDDVDLVVRAGEVVGLAGLDGSGAAALLLSVYGRSTGAVPRGSVWVAGVEADTSTVERAVAAGLFLVAVDPPQYRVRFVGGVSMPATASTLPTLVSLGLVDRDSESETGEGRIAQTIGALRGTDDRVDGIVSSFAESDRSVLLLIDPTRGLGPERRAAIHAGLREIAAQGKAVVVCSSELAELVAVSDRIVGLADGRLSGEWTGGDIAHLAALIAPH